MMIVALDAPDFRSISDFRKRHLKALGALFLQVLRLCEAAGLVKLGHVALDGTKIKANASKHKAMSYERMKKREAELQAEVARMLAAAEAADALEDETFGKDKQSPCSPQEKGHLGLLSCVLLRWTTIPYEEGVRTQVLSHQGEVPSSPLDISKQPTAYECTRCLVPASAGIQ